MSKIYTKTGDSGKTSLANGERLQKSHCVISAYGEVDELNASLGLLESELQIKTELLSLIQNNLFSIGAELAHPTGTTQDWYIQDHDTKHLENDIDAMNTNLPALKNFILPGGDKKVALIHVSRTICRRAERSVVSIITESNDVRPEIIQYLNRLSDWLFVLARFVGKAENIAERIWIAKKK